MDARSENLAARFAYSFDDTCRRSLSIACEHGHLDLLAYWLDNSSLTPPLHVNAFVPGYRPDEMDEQGVVVGAHEGIAAPLLWVAALHGQCDLVQELLARGVDLEAPASDGSTPFFVACEHGHTAMLHLLAGQKVDMCCLNQDGTAPIYAAATSGHLGVVQFLHDNGVDIQTIGTLRWWDEKRGDYLRTGITLRKIAQECCHTLLLQWLDEVNQPVAGKGKRERSSTAQLERAQLAGVADMLKPIPPGLHTRIASGSKEDAAVAKKELYKLQKYNNQVISRAEKKKLKLKQSTLSFTF